MKMKTYLIVDKTIGPYALCKHYPHILATSRQGAVNEHNWRLHGDGTIVDNGRYLALRFKHWITHVENCQKFNGTYKT